MTDLERLARQAILSHQVGEKYADPVQVEQWAAFAEELLRAVHKMYFHEYDLRFESFKAAVVRAAEEGKR